MLKATALTTTLALVVGTTNGLDAQTSPLFRGLPTVGVHVVGVTPAAAALGVDTLDLRNRAESSLKRAGFEVPNAIDLVDQPDTPRLVVNIGFFATRDSSAIYSVLLELLEKVEVKRNGYQTHAVGWSEQILGLTPAKESGQAARQAVDQLIKLFVTQTKGAPVESKPTIGGGR